MKKTIAVLSFGLMLSGVASKASAVEFRGDSSCGDWVKARSVVKLSWSEILKERWLVGYLKRRA